MRFFHFHIPADYKLSYDNISSIDPGQMTPEGVLAVNSTGWLDIKLAEDRRVITSHMLALIAWTNEVLV